MYTSVYYLHHFYTPHQSLKTSVDVKHNRNHNQLWALQIPSHPLWRLIIGLQMDCCNRATGHWKSFTHSRLCNANLLNQDGRANMSHILKRKIPFGIMLIVFTPEWKVIVKMINLCYLGRKQATLLARNKSFLSRSHIVILKVNDLQSKFDSLPFNVSWRFIYTAD